MDIKDLRHIVYAYFDGITPQSYKHHVKEWLVAHGQEAEKDAVMHEIWNASEPESADVERALAVFRHNRGLYERRRHRRIVLRRVAGWAAVMLLPLLAAVVSWTYSARYHSEKNLVELYVPEGKIDSLMLSDGTKVIVNSKTTLLYPSEFNMRSGNRDVFLMGEAHFDVAKNEACPFIVHSGKLNIQVLGTHFNVKAYSDEELITTTLEEGKVKVFDDSYSAMMKPNEQIAYSRNTGRMEKKIVEVGAYNEWTSGALRFDNQSLRKILSDIGLRYDVKFKVDASVDLNRRYTMNFDREETVEDVMGVLLKLTNHLYYHKQGQTIKLYRSRKEGVH